MLTRHIVKSKQRRLRRAKCLPFMYLPVVDTDHPPALLVRNRYHQSDYVRGMLEQVIEERIDKLEKPPQDALLP